MSRGANFKPRLLWQRLPMKILCCNFIYFNHFWYIATLLSCCIRGKTQSVHLQPASMSIGPSQLSRPAPVAVEAPELRATDQAAVVLRERRARDRGAGRQAGEDACIMVTQKRFIRIILGQTIELLLMKGKIKERIFPVHVCSHVGMQGCRNLPATSFELSPSRFRGNPRRTWIQLGYSERVDDGYDSRVSARGVRDGAWWRRMTLDCRERADA